MSNITNIQTPISNNQTNFNYQFTISKNLDIVFFGHWLLVDW